MLQKKGLERPVVVTPAGLGACVLRTCLGREGAASPPNPGRLVHGGTGGAANAYEAPTARQGPAAGFPVCSCPAAIPLLSLNAVLNFPTRFRKVPRSLPGPAEKGQMHPFRLSPRRLPISLLTGDNWQSGWVLNNCYGDDLLQEDSVLMGMTPRKGERRQQQGSCWVSLRVPLPVRPGLGIPRGPLPPPALHLGHVPL